MMNPDHLANPASDSGIGRRGFFRRSAGLGLAGVAAGIAGPGIGRAEEGEEGKSALVTTPPVAMAPRPDGFDVVWGVGRLARGWVEARAEDGWQARFDHDGHGFVPQNGRRLHVRVDAAPAGARVAWRAVTEAMEGETARHETGWRTFKLPDAAAANARFAVWNDTHENRQTLETLDGITPRNIDFLAWNGDICNDWHQESWFEPVFLHPAGRDFTAGRPLALVPGNHDVRGKYAFRLPEFSPMPEGRPFFAARFGPVACLFLNTGEDKADDHPSFRGRVAFEPLRRQQADWLKEATTAPGMRDAPYRVAFCHLPMRWIDENRDRDYDRFSWRSRDLWHDSLVAWKTQVVISGHTHRHRWIPPAEGFPYAQLVGGGPQPERATLITGEADGEALTLRLAGIDGTVHETCRFPPIA